MPYSSVTTSTAPSGTPGSVKATLHDLGIRLRKLETAEPAFVDRATDPPRRALGRGPSSLVAQIGFAEWTSDVRLRQPRFLGLHDDKNPTGIVRERPSERGRSRCRLNEGSTEVVGCRRHSGKHKEVPTTGRAYVVHQRFTDEPGLNGLELPFQILLIAREDQTLIEVSVHIDSTVIVEGPPEYPARFCLRLCGDSPTVCARSSG